MILCKQDFAAGHRQSRLPRAAGRTAGAHHCGQGRRFREALQPEFRDYAKQIVANAKVLADTLAAEGFRIISGGTDTHLMLVDVFAKGMLGSEAEKALGEAGITVNKNAIPFDTNPPMKPSGIRIGTPGSDHARHERSRNAPDRPLDRRGLATIAPTRRRSRKVRRQVLELAEVFPALSRAPGKSASRKPAPKS